ncbi:vacuolar protein-sorting-associated protein 37 homolog 1-like [Aristolochia californica]|uniref:vacuolar protein-sorting-associated protein 37 homolog 1-like n=1 Tax=Aristolochia californica TaxID=171875 RepID=UPI0035D7CFC9
MDGRRQCTVIRAELSAAHQRFNELKKLEEKINSVYSISSLQDRLRGEALIAANGCEVLYHKFLSGEIPVSEFITSYKKERTLLHRRMLTYLASKSCLL